jgi:hypothetical protein
MKRLIALLWIPLVPVGLFAQGTSPSAALHGQPTAAPVASTASPVATLLGRPTSVAPLPAQPPAPNRRRRRGSMVGYIADGEIGSKVRFRADAGFHIDTPDRAEFFYAKCGCYRDLAGDAAFDPDAPGPGPGIVTDMNFKALSVHGEYAPTDRISVFAVLPLRWIQPQSFAAAPPGSFQKQGGIGDVQAGVKFALVNTPDNTVTLQLQGYFPTGKALKGLGTDHVSVEPALLLNHRLSDRLAVEGQLGDWHPIGGSAGVPTTSSDKFAGDVLFYGIGPSYELYKSGNEDWTFTPVVELVGWRVLSGFQTSATSDASGTNIVNLKVGARVGWREEASLYVGYGQALTTAVWYDNIFRVEYRVVF